MAAKVAKGATPVVGTSVTLDEDIGGAGAVHTIEWSPAAGATAAQVQDASVTITPSVVVETTEDVPVGNDGGWVVTVPTGKRVKHENDRAAARADDL